MWFILANPINLIKLLLLKNLIEWLPLKSWFNLVTHSITSKSKVKVINNRAGNVGFVQSKSLHSGDLMSSVQSGEKLHDWQFISRDVNLLLEYEEIINCQQPMAFFLYKEQNVWSTWMNWRTSIGLLGYSLWRMSHLHLDRSVHTAHWQDC